MNESQLQRVYNYPIYPRDSKIYSDKGFVGIDNGTQGGIHWTGFYIKDKKSFISTRLDFNLMNFFSSN